MKEVGSGKTLLYLFLFVAPGLVATDLSTYRGFHFGMNLDAAVKLSGMDPSEATISHLRPAKIQELNWRPVRFSLSETDPVDKVFLTFYNGELYQIVVKYSMARTKGLTSNDIIQAVSTKYGPATRPLGRSSQSSAEPVEVLARWEDAEYSCDLVQSSFGLDLNLLILSKRLKALADTALTEGTRLDAQEAPARLKLDEQNAAADLRKNRAVNKANFRP